MTTEALASIDQIRTNALERMFGRTRRLAPLIFGPVVAVVALWAAWNGSGLQRMIALGLFGALGLVNLLKLPHYAHWALSLGVVAVSGGVASPLLPFLLLLSFKNAAISCRSIALTLTGLLIAAVLGMALFGPHDWMRAGVMMALLVGAYFTGRLIYRMSDEMVHSSFEARDQILEVHKDRLQELCAVRGEMADALKNPLASIKGLVGLVALEPDRARERLDVLKREVCRAESIVEEYLSFARPMTPLKTEPIDVARAVGEVTKLHEVMASAREVTFDLTQVESLAIVGDRQKLRQMLISLIVNAIEASPPGSAVELVAQRDEERFRIEVRDRGPGVPKELLARLAEPGLTTKSDGTGLGLTIVRALAAQHGGRLQLRNREGGGFVAGLELPLHCACGRAVA